VKFKCLVVNQTNSTCKLEERKISDQVLNPGELWIKSTYSGINYKDALGVTFKAPIYKQKIIIPGIDVAGYVYESKSKKFKHGDLVLVNGMGLGESMDGGFSEFVKVHEDTVVVIPKGLSDKEAMALGTSGFTAALAIDRMFTNGQTFDKGPILVSGSTGGVGQFAIQILNQLGFFVEAVTSREEYTPYLESIGAHYVSLLKDHIAGPSAKTDESIKPSLKPLERVEWGGAIDNLGGEFLASILPRIELWGNVASIGLAQSSELKSTVMPFILRGVSLLGASSNNCPMDTRHKIWNLLADDWKPKFLNKTISAEITLKEVVEVSKNLVGHTHSGKTIIKY
jgi:acrylyl-CoA reductase (NADPH)